MVRQFRSFESQEAGRSRAELIAQSGKVVLCRYAPDGAKAYPVPVFIVTPLLVKPYILDLSPALSFVDHLNTEGFDVFLIDFGTPDASDIGRRFEDYLDDIALALESTLTVSQSVSATLLGYCLGGLFAVLYAVADPGRVKNVITVAAPFDFSQGGPLYRWLRRLDVDRVVDAFGNIPGEWIRDQIRLFAMTAQPKRNLRIWLDLVFRSWDREYLEKQRLLNHWLQDLRAFPGEAYRQFIKEFVQANKLVKGELSLAGKPIHPSHITSPVLVLAHTEDLLAPPDSAKALVDLVASEDREFFEVSGGNVGHVDIIIGEEGPKVTWPKVSTWLKSRSGAPCAT
jgi:polyhydroxyalkanoate synthase